MHLICLDPATRTGFATSDGRSGVEDLSPAKARAGKPGRPAKVAKKDGRILRPEVAPVPATAAEPDDERLVKLWRLLNRLHCQTPGWPFSTRDLVLVHEGPLSHHAGVRAAQLAFWWQATIALWCREACVRRIEVPPRDLQRFVLGRCSTPGQNEVLEAARERLGYQGSDDNEADALWLLEWAKRHVTGVADQPAGPRQANGFAPSCVDSGSHGVG